MISRDLKIGIAGGVISSVIVLIFIQPTLSFLWSAIISFGETVQAGYVDKIYRAAALGDRNLAGHLTLLIVLMFAHVGVMSYISGGNRMPRLSDKTKSKAVKIMAVLFTSIMFVVMMIACSISMGVNEIKASFEQRLTVMAPYITDLEAKKIKARWATMKGRSEYTNLVDSMDSRAIELKITLPVVRTP